MFELLFSGVVRFQNGTKAIQNIPNNNISKFYISSKAMCELRSKIYQQVVIKSLTVSMSFHTILQKVTFCVLWNKVSHTGL